MISAPRPTAFLCHSSADKPLAERLATDLITQGVVTFFDKWSLQPGDSLARKIEEGINGASHFVILVTPNSLISNWCQHELDMALIKRLAEECRVIPIFHGVDPSKLRLSLRAILGIRLDDYDRVVKAVVDACFGRSDQPLLGLPPDAVASSTGDLTEMSLSPIGQQLAVWLSSHFPQGLTHEYVAPDRTAVSQSGLTAAEFAIALSEIEDLGLITIERCISSPFDIPPELAGIFHVGPTPRFFMEIDRLLCGYDPDDDAVAVAALVANLKGVSPGTYASLTWIAEQTSWPKRRVNAACYYLIENEFVTPSRELQGEWACSGFSIKPRFARLSLGSR